VHENIILNAVCPNVVRTNISTATFYEDLEKNNLLTPLDTIVGALESMMGTDSRTGLTLECGPMGVYPRTAHEFLDEETRRSCKIIENRCKRLYGVPID